MSITPPDPIPPPVTIESEHMARKTLLTMARFMGGFASALGDWANPVEPARNSFAIIGYAIMAFDGHDWQIRYATCRNPTWVWAKADQTLAWRVPASLGRDVIPLGRIDRGLQA